MSMSDAARAPPLASTASTEDRTLGEKAKGALNTAGEMTYNVLDSTGRMTMDALATVGGKTKDALNNAGVMDALSSASETTKDALSNAAAKTQELAQQLKDKVVGASSETCPEKKAILDREIAEQKRKLDQHLLEMRMNQPTQEMSKCQADCLCTECAYNRKPVQQVL